MLAIKQTIYRTGSESPLMDLLIEAVRRGKEVMAVVELKARFDEEANINWAERLEAVGAQVVYGVVGLKTHAKLLLVTRREGGRLRRYAHLSTGNYNPTTARLYTDIGYLTADPELTADVDAVFQQLASLGRTRPLRDAAAGAVHAAQADARRTSRRSAAAAAAGAAGAHRRQDQRADRRAADRGAGRRRPGAAREIDLIVRGACMLPPGVPGVTDHIRVRSVVGRFLEHIARRLLPLGRRARTTRRCILSSADWMSRNMFRRIEVAWPVRDPALRQRVIDECLVPYLHDGQDAWTLEADGSYSRVARRRPVGAAGADGALCAREGRRS